MCGIFAFIGDSIEYNELYYNFNKIKGRGPDYSELLKVQSNIFLGFHRLSIIDQTSNGNQPFNIDGIYLICNGEIYNHNDLKIQNDFITKSNSDCEIIIHMYKKYGILETIKNLDGVFAFILYDSKLNKLFIGRDAFGVRPLFYGINKEKKEISFSSEMKSICNFSDIVEQFKPGHYTVLDLEENTNKVTNDIYEGRFYYWSWYDYPFDTNITNKMDIDEILYNIKTKLIHAVNKRLMSDRPIGCLLSGGLDSSLICSIVSRFFKKNNKGVLNTFSIGLPGSTDLKYAKKVSEHIGSCHHEVILSEKDFLDAIPKVIYSIESYDTTTVRASTANYLIGKYIKENTDITVVYNGDGSDEQSGYIYLANAPTLDDFQNECVSLLKNIHYFDVLRSDRSISSEWSLEARTPFLDKEFVKFYMSINPKLKNYNNKIEKELLRKAFEDDKFLPHDVLWRRKEAFSDGCSSNERSWHNIIKEHVDKIISDDELMYCDIQHNKPLMKESLYYRQIFNRFFPNKDNVIPKFWLPKWTDAIDPSARELNNY
jgi:asparagine synthase (glutamine-hydrolysing)